MHIKKHAYKRYGVNLNPRKDLKPLLAVAKKSRQYAWLKKYDSIALQQAVINLHTAFDNFFNPKLKARFPAFKSKHVYGGEQSQLRSNYGLTGKINLMESCYSKANIPVIFQVASLLAALAHPGHIVIYAPGDSLPCRRDAS
ncbi:hypothetical protein CKY02_07530 [Photorhabdus bodei]|uniref:Transposase n=1 Tax=Photorhabdus bodei TaxID=2029681 RepID=A0A329X906_9GAMM|nr:hypothetical protein CKY02_07530 [Photorhabdus bodei]